MVEIELEVERVVEKDKVEVEVEEALIGLKTLEMKIAFIVLKK